MLETDDKSTEDWRVVFDSRSRRECSERGLVLHSLDIPYEIVTDGSRFMAVVPAGFAERARFEIWQYEQENRKPRPRKPLVTPVHQNAIPGVSVYVVMIVLVAWLAGEAAFSRDWFYAGRVDGQLIRQGEWWRTITALTLHSGVRHLAGNIGFGILFGLMAGRLLGSGVTWLTIVIASGIANFLNTILLQSTHRAIGASTAVFAALGLVSGFVWRARLMSQDRWPYRLGPVIGGVALLAYTGTGDANTDIGAHLAGFVCGFLSGMIMIRFYDYVPRRNVQLVSGVTAVLIVALAWAVAL